LYKFYGHQQLLTGATIADVALNRAKFIKGLQITVAYALDSYGVQSSDVNVTSLSSKPSTARRLLSCCIYSTYTITHSNSNYTDIMTTLNTAIQTVIFGSVLQETTGLSSIQSGDISFSNISPTPMPTVKPKKPLIVITKSLIAGAVVGTIIGFICLAIGLTCCAQQARKPKSFGQESFSDLDGGYAAAKHIQKSMGF
jgi:hypothetical protein